MWAGQWGSEIVYRHANSHAEAEEARGVKPARLGLLM